VNGLADKILALDRAMTSARIPHAFGGALALAWCTQRPRGTVDIDLNLFVSPEHAPEVVAALPPAVACTEAEVEKLHRDGQARLWWDATPVDVFLSTTEYHYEVAARVHREPFAGGELPFLACTDLAVFKAFFNRTRDWADIEDMTAADTLDSERVLGVLVRFLGPGDERVERLRRLSQ
jgi:hypothetical protein